MAPDPSVFAAGAGGTAGVSAFSTDATTGAFAATRSSRFGSTFGEVVIIEPPAIPIIAAANTVPTPAKKEVVLKAICVLHISKATPPAEPAFPAIAVSSRHGDHLRRNK
jgi:hypothetical protein